MADRTTLLQLLVWCKPVQGYLLMRRQQLDSRAWVAKRTAEVLERSSHDVPGGFVDVEEVCRSADYSGRRILLLWVVGWRRRLLSGHPTGPKNQIHRSGVDHGLAHGMVTRYSP